jgi:hypothetical protein
MEDGGKSQLFKRNFNFIRDEKNLKKNVFYNFIRCSFCAKAFDAIVEPKFLDEKIKMHYKNLTNVELDLKKMSNVACAFCISAVKMSSALKNQLIEVNEEMEAATKAIGQKREPGTSRDSNDEPSAKKKRISQSKFKQEPMTSEGDSEEESFNESASQSADKSRNESPKIVVNESPKSANTPKHAAPLKGNRNSKNGSAERPKIFKCFHCEKSYADRWHRRNHIQVVHMGGRFQCPIVNCSVTMTRKDTLSRHIAGNHSELTRDGLAGILQFVKDMQPDFMYPDLQTDD